MSPQALLRLTLQDIRAGRARSAIATAGIALGVWVLTLVVALGLGVQDTVLREVVRELPVDTVEVIAKTLDLGLFKMGAGSLFGGAGLNQATVDKLTSLPEVSAAYPKLEVRLPLGAQGGARLFGRRLYTDLFMTGVPPALVQNEGVVDFVDNPEVIATVVNPQLVELYNASVAPAMGSPLLSAQTLVGFEFDIVIGRSLMLGQRGARTTGVERGRLVGTSRYAMQLGVTVPMQTAQRLLQQYGEPAAVPTFSGILVHARSPADVPTIVQAAEALGFTVDDTALKTRRLLTAGTALAAAVGLLVLALAALNIAHSFFAMLNERRRELAVLRALGARQQDLMALVLTQALLLGLVGGVLGVAMARLAGLGIDAAAHAFVPNFPFKPASFFLFPTWLLAAGLAAAAGAAVLGAVWPGTRAATRPISQGLAD